MDNRIMNKKMRHQYLPATIVVAGLFLFSFQSFWGYKICQASPKSQSSANTSLFKKTITYFKNAEYEKAKQGFVKLLQQNPDEKLYKKAISECDKYLSLSRNHDIQTILGAQKKTIAQDKVSLHFKNISLNQIFGLLADEMGVSLSMPKDLQKTISIDMNDVPIDDVVNSIARKNDLKIEKTDKTLYVDRRESHSPGQVFDTYVIPLKSITPEEAEKAIALFLSEQGRIAVNKASNRILVQDYPDVISNLIKVFPQFDPEPKQVVVEAALLQITRSNKTAVGFNWFGSDSTQRGSKLLKGDLQSYGFTTPPSPAANALYTTLSYTNIGTIIEAAKKQTNMEVLSAPQILAMEGHEAKIIVGKKLGYRTVTTTSSQTTMENIDFLEVGTQLTVKAQILDDHSILMDIHPEVSDGDISSQGLPTVNTSEATTRVIIESGQTLVIGGLINKKVNKNVIKIPILGDIPLLGRIFRRTEDEKSRSELIVLISPHLEGKRTNAEAKSRFDEIEKFKAKYK